METPLNQPPQNPPTQPNYLKWILIGCGGLLIVGLVVVMAAFAMWFYYSQPDSGARRTRSSGEVKLVDDHGIETVAKRSESCTA